MSETTYHVIRKINDDLDRALRRFQAGGAAVRAETAGTIADLFTARAALARDQQNGTTLLGELATIAAESDRRVALEWTGRQAVYARVAGTIAADASAAFDDGMTYVPGRGRIRATSPVTGETNRLRRDVGAEGA